MDSLLQAYQQAKPISYKTKILAIIGPSGAGKSTTVRALSHLGLIYLTPSWTTRPLRSGESLEQSEHIFVSKQQFTSLKNEGFFIHTATLFNSYLYGMPPVKAYPHRIPCVILRHEVIAAFTAQYPNTITYNLIAPQERIKARLQERNLEQAELKNRLKRYRAELTQGRRQANRTIMLTENADINLRQVTHMLSNDFVVQ